MSNSKKYLTTIEAAAIIVGQIIGIGLFFKNHTIFEYNDNNPWGVIISWLIGGFLTFCVCMSLAKLSSIKQKQFHTKGIGQWVGTTTSSKFGNFGYTFMNIVYYPAIFLLYTVFAVEPICQCFSYKVPFYAVCLISLVVTWLFISFNYLCHKLSNKLNPFLGYAKFLPLILCLVASILVVTLGKIDGMPYDNLFKQNGASTPSLIGILDSLPYIVFAYNGYIVIGSMTEQIQNPEKKMNKIILISIFTVTFIYIGVAILMLINGSADGKVLDIFGTRVGTKVMSFVLFFVALCSVGLFASASYSTIGDTIEKKQLVFHEYFKSLNDKKTGSGTFIAFNFINIVYFVLFVIPGIIINKDAPLDVITNAISYSSLIVLLVGFYGMLIKKYQNKISDNFTIKQYIMIWTSLIILTSALLVSYVIIPIITQAPSDAGIFYTPVKISRWLDSTILIVSTGMCALVVFLNLYIINRKK